MVQFQVESVSGNQTNNNKKMTPKINGDETTQVYVFISRTIFEIYEQCFMEFYCFIKFNNKIADFLVLSPIPSLPFSLFFIYFAFFGYTNDNSNILQVLLL